ncbi:heterokaryon incompatibility protein (HET) domain-containing protein [Trichoderma breve]|uniref:Heterokaryon incompatibility protein (HET) domain-containing protein n=1 Tax=Trichoderma breve TaxID=2034170 RepID=A0A9W9BJA1_9HYPO|nr:heterokaryon incompatibility protein (HET) domain-containing protein [Trichoderma breve]KAJ4861390.1 heterokaryon incompatibility protein (HET) domain-containing protein [Trichoderma breve]
MDNGILGSVVDYQYEPLKDSASIRLLYLHPGSFHQLPIKVSLQEFPVNACPSFGALSYTWATEDGAASLSRELLCNGASLRITENCEAALKRLRRPTEDQVLWVDAVCIDQSNIEERSLQIGLMRQIYSQASWVALWVGESSSVVDEETERKNSGQDPCEGPLYQEFIKDRQAFQHSNSEVFTPRVRGLWDVFHRKWWDRLWVIQEVALSKEPTLVCGGKAETFHNLKIVIEALISSEQPVEVMEFNTLFIASTFHQFHALRILNATRNAKASDPRDKIYGILGFFGASGKDPENIFPEPDYKKTAAELYADVSRAIIINTGKLDVLSSCYGFIKSSVPNLPSWAVSWNDTPLKYFDDEIFNAAGASSVIYEDSDDKLLLRIKGNKVDTVKLTGQLPDSIGYSNGAYIELWRYWWKFVSDLKTYPTGDTISDAFQDTLCWGSDDTDTAAKNIFDSKEPYKYAHRASSITWGRNMGITDKGYLATVPITTKVGDEIVIFEGAKLPFVVRTEGGKSKLGGPCYVRGMMDGEFSTKEDAQATDELEWFTLQ